MTLTIAVHDSAAATTPLDGLLAPGPHYINGDEAAAEGAIAANARYFAAYPITPATEVAETCAGRFPDIGGMFVQMEDELGAMNAVLGGAWGGAKSLTSTSGPGFSLMMENLGLGIITETPCVVVNVQRCGPSTGLPTAVGQQDMMQAKWGSHGDYQIIALCPDSPQECFDLAIRAFNLAERFRTPVLLMMDEITGHMTEKVIVPPREEIPIVPRRAPTVPHADYWPYTPGPDGVCEMARAGDGYFFHTTGLTHDHRGYPVLTAEVQAEMQERLTRKILDYTDEIIDSEDVRLDDADVALVAYGVTARVARSVVQMARAEGIKLGMLRLITAWPFPDDLIRRLADRVSDIIVPEINLGQIVREVERASAGRARILSVPHAGGGMHDEATVMNAVRQVITTRSPNA